MLRFASALAPTAIRALGRTYRLRVIGDHHHRRVRDGGAYLFAVWHGRMLLPIYRHRDAGVLGMVSLSQDGDLTTRVLEGLGYHAVRGSSSRGGREAYHSMLEAVTGGAAGAIIPDGPRGPARQLKPGLLYLAQAAGVPILPLSSSAAPARKFRSWDRFLLPFPFARCVVVYGEPIEVARDLSTERIEQLRQHLERTLSRLETEADAEMGLLADVPEKNSQTGGALE